MRILAGEFKGRKLLSPPRGAAVRPITGYAKKSLFDILGGLLVDATIVDLYCGTGSQGLEALSRGAGRCFFADRDRAVLSRLRRNIEDMDLAEKCDIWKGDIPARLKAWLETIEAPIDIAFVDPPYEQVRRWPWETIAKQIFQPLAASLRPDGLVVLRVPTKVDVPTTLGSLTQHRVKTCGDMKLIMFIGQASADDKA